MILLGLRPGRFILRGFRPVLILLLLAIAIYLLLHFQKNRAEEEARRQVEQAHADSTNSTGTDPE